MSSKEKGDQIEKDVKKKDEGGTRVDIKNLGTYKESKQSFSEVGLGEYIRIFFVGFVFSFYYITLDNKKRIFLFAIGCSTIVLVATIMSLLQNFIRKAPLIFLKISEDTTSEADIYILPNFHNESQNALLNFTDIESKLLSSPLITGASPRWVFGGIIKNRDDPDRRDKVTVMATDTEREEQMGLGRAWPHRILGEMELHVKEGLLWTIGLPAERGARCMIELDLSSFMSGVNGDDRSIEAGIDPEDDEDDEDDDDLLNTDDIDQEEAREQLKELIEGLGLNTTQPVSDMPEFFVPEEYQYMYDNDNYTIGDMLDAMINETISEDGESLLVLEGEFTIVENVVWNLGKYPNAMGNIVVMDSKFLDVWFDEMFSSNPIIPLLMGGLTTTDDDDDDSDDDAASFDITSDDFDWYENVFMIVAMYRDRFEAYRLKDDAKENILIQLTDEIATVLGISADYQIQLPTVEGMVMFDFIGLFLDQILFGIVVCLSASGTILIYSLLLSNVEEKTYEYGMLRALGLQQPALIQMTFIQAFYFAVPGLIVATIITFALNIPIDWIMAYYIQMPYLDLSFSWDSIVIPICLGLVIPFVSNIIPVRTAIGKTLRDSLDVTRQSINETTVRIQKLENLGLELWQTTLALVMIIFGFIVYYIMPLSFIFDQMSIFMYTLEVIFIGMLAGLCILAVLFEPIVERVILEFFLFINILFPKDRRVKNLIIKNLAGHRNRSRKAFLMFTLTVGFVVFSGVNFAQLVDVVQGNLGLIVGADMAILSNTFGYNIRQDELLDFLEEQKEIGNITSYSFATFELGDYDHVDESRFSNMAIFPREDCRIYGVDQNYLETAFSHYYIPTETNFAITTNKIGLLDNLFDSLYTNKGKAEVLGLNELHVPINVMSGRKVDVDENWDDFDPSSSYDGYFDVILSEATRDFFGLNANMPCMLNIKLENGYYSKFIAKPHGTLSKCPGFFYSSYKIAAMMAPVLMTFESFATLANLTAQQYGSKKKFTWDNVMFEMLYIRMLPGNEVNHRRQFVSKLKVNLDADNINIMDVEDLLISTQGAVIGFTVCFYVGGTIALVFCTYMLALSFVSNVRDSSWEFGVLRACGFTAWMLVRAYIYEAMVLVMAAFMLGTLVGCIIGASLVAQFNVFLEMPFTFDFPFDLVFGMFGIAVALAFVGSYLPAKRIRDREIALVLKGLE